jgi:hypothetical protein
MKYLRLLLEVRLQEDLVGFFLGFSENDCSTVASTVEVDDVSDDGVSMIVGAVEGEVLDSLGGPDFGIFDEVDELSVG